MDPLPPTAPPPRPRRLLRFMIKAPLGCLAFFLGVVAVSLLFMPWACGNAVREELVTSFNANYAGRLDVGQTWLLSLYGPQWMEDVELCDPEGELVMRGRVRAPRLLSWFVTGDREDPNHWGPVKLLLDRVNLFEDENGVTNLARAVTPREGKGWSGLEVEVGPRRGGLEIRSTNSTVGLPDPHGVGLEVGIQRISWSNPASRREGRLLRAEDVTLEGVLAGGQRGLSLRLAGGGVLFPAPSPEARQGTVRLDLVSDGLRSFPDLGVGATWRFEIEARDVFTHDLDLLLGTEGVLETAFGPWLDDADLTLARREDGRLYVVRFRLRSSLAQLSLVEGVVRDDGTVTAGADGVLTIEFPVRGWWTEEALRPFLPLCGEVTAIDTSRPGEFRMVEFTLSDRTGFLGGSGRTRIDLPLSKWSLPASLRGGLDEVRARPFRAEAISVSSRLDAGVLHFDRQELFAASVPLRFSGTCDIARGTVDLELDWPTSWPPTPVGGAEDAVGVRGTWDAMAFVDPRQ